MSSRAIERVFSGSLCADRLDQRAAMRLITSCWPQVMSPQQPLDTDTEVHDNMDKKAGALLLLNSKMTKHADLNTGPADAVFLPLTAAIF